MSHTSDSNITDCLPTIDQLNHAVRSIVRAVPSSHTEPKVQRKHPSNKKLAYKTKEPPKYADVVLPTSKSKQVSDGLTDSQAVRAITIAGSFKPIQPKMEVDGSSLNLPANKLPSTTPQPDNSVLIESSGGAHKVVPMQEFHTTQSLPQAKESHDPMSSLFGPSSHPTQKSFSTVSSIALSPSLGHSTFSPTLQEGHVTSHEVSLYSHSVDLQKTSQGQANCDLHVPPVSGQSLCVSPPTVPPSVLEALNIKDGTHLFPALQNNASIQVLSIDNILGHNQLSSYQTSPIPSVGQTQRSHDYADHLVTMGYHTSSFDTSTLHDSKPPSHQSEDTDSANSGNGSSLTKENSSLVDSYGVKNISTSCMYQTSDTMSPTVQGAADVSQIRPKGSLPISEDVVIELLLSKNESGELERVSVLTPSSEPTCHQMSALTQEGEHTHQVDEGAETVGHPPPTTGVYCVDCSCLYDISRPCSVHVQHVSYIPDSVLPSRAMASLPRQLSVAEVDDKGTKGIFANEDIPKGTSFDPLQGVLNPIIQKDRMKCSNSNIWQIFEEGAQTHELDCTDENISNWLMFVQPAKFGSEQNVVAFQIGLTIHFVAKCDIEAADQLKYWYSTDYATLKGCSTNPDQLYVCSLCKRTFPNIRMLERHISRQHPDTSKRKYVCEVCEKPFTSATKLGVHLRSHGGIRPFSCPQCHKTFTDRSNLKVHLKIHSGEKRHQCFVCGNSFRQKAHLESHSLTHTGAKPHRCTFCEKTYARQSDLNTHERTHTKAGCFQCQICQKTFAKMQNYQKHQLTHSRERNHLCPRCSRGFGTKYHLARHQVTCKGVKQKKVELNPQTGAELGLSIAKKRIQKRDQAEQAAKILQSNSSVT